MFARYRNEEGEGFVEKEEKLLEALVWFENRRLTRAPGNRTQPDSEQSGPSAAVVSRYTSRSRSLFSHPPFSALLVTVLQLEKFKFVLDHKIKELKKQIEPKEEEIADMKDQIKARDYAIYLEHGPALCCPP